MAKIFLSIEELIKILVSNELLPKNIVRVKAKNDSVHFYIKTQSFILPFIPASLRFLNCSNNNVIFKLTVVNSQVSKLINRFDQLFDITVPAYMRLEYPNIVVDIDMLLQEINIRGLRLKSASFENNEFVVETEST